MDIGPLELIVLVFPGARANPAVAEILAGVVSGGYVTVLDLAFVTRTSDGSLRTTDVEGDRHEIGLGSLEISAKPLITKDQLDAVRDSLKPGTSAAVIAYEHSWVRRLAGTVTNAGGAIARTAMSTGTASDGGGAESGTRSAPTRAAAGAAERRLRLRPRPRSGPPNSTRHSSRGRRRPPTPATTW